MGKYPCVIEEGSLAHKAYQKDMVYERHRHRYEVNNQYEKQFQEAGMIFSGKNPEMDLVEIIEIPKHSWFLGVQFHPEFKSRPNRAHPLFREFVKSALNSR